MGIVSFITIHCKEQLLVTLCSSSASVASVVRRFASLKKKQRPGLGILVVIEGEHKRNAIGTY